METLRQLIVDLSKERWFLPDEIEVILSNNLWVDLEFPLSKDPPVNPSSGQFYFYELEKKALKFKNDGVEYALRKRGDRIQESYHNFKINGIERINGNYCRGKYNKSFCRRIYRLLNSGSSDDVAYVMIHYRVETVGEDKQITKSQASMWKSMLREDSFDMDIVQELQLWSEFVESNDDEKEASSMVDLSQHKTQLSSSPLFSTRDGSLYSSLLTSALDYSSSSMRIEDFAPSCGSCLGGSKVLIVLNQPISPHLQPISIMFGSYSSECELVAGNVVRCYTPTTSSPGSMPLTLVSSQNQTLTISTANFTFTATESKSVAPINSLPVDERQRKIRIVEKLGKTIINSHVQQIDDSIIHERQWSPVNITADSDVDMTWLTDSELSNLAPHELEAIMEKYVTAFVRQLVQLAAVDDDLKAELHDLDSCGFSLLHYCCMYSSTSNLVPILLSKGVNVNQQSSSGKTALHLAVEVGNLELIRVLKTHGASDTISDAQGFTPRDKAIAAGLSQYFPPSADPAAGSSSTAMESIVGSDQSPESTNAILLMEAFSSLSLADKCALSLSLGHTNLPSAPGAKSPITGKLSRNSSDVFTVVDEVEHVNVVDMQSVINDTDKESLDMAMSMMGQHELLQLEDEVKIIQANVRTWILRKNYINLRESAKILQGFWRDRKRVTREHQSTPLSSQRHQKGGNYSEMRRMQAAATLQAATRGMIARKSFNRIRRQAMASLIIQNTFIHWWQRKSIK